MHQLTLRQWVVASVLILVSHSAFSAWEVSGSLSGELRMFPNKPAFPEQNKATMSPSVAFEPQFLYQWNNNKDRFNFIPFGRWDADDDNRTHVDLREANWVHIGENYDLVVGVGKVFWGVTESRHLVDIINQTDAVEDVDGEDKLGQPMINLNLIQSWGTLGLYVLPGFRERTFQDSDARLRGAVQIDDNQATYDSDDKAHHVDVAVRWTHNIGQWDIGLAHFHGTSREPRLIPTVRSGRTILIPHYDQINQSSLDIQLTSDSTLWKLEVIRRSGQGKHFFAGVGGFEYTFYGTFETQADVGVLMEYLYDNRDNATAPASATDDDLFIAARLTLNDTQDTTFLAGAIIDRSNQTTLFSLEAGRRLNDHWKLEVEGRFFSNVSNDSLFNGIRKDDFITLRLSRYF